MGNYMNISDEAQSLLVEIANNKSDSAGIRVCQLDLLGERAGLHISNVYAIAHELKDVGIVKIGVEGKELFPDKPHVEEFQRQFPTK